jgi:ketosteroid isomerase-like protein
MNNTTIHFMMVSTLLLLSGTALASEQDAAIVAALDKQFQAAVKANDYATMQKLLANDFVLVVGTGQVSNKADLIGEAKKGTTKYEHQEEIDNSQTVRLWGDTAVVTAKLWMKETFEGHASEAKLWFSDTYVRTRLGWQYVFGQASSPLPSKPVPCRTAHNLNTP